ncbi:integrase, catalytic region, zinc finger, CCHC-type containing protein [Tanacetum coccineum]|uniref:Integrase, catalytic region, zinc finger, CCHC-type containing protein n=1 Tax=Tanacetum coccineum TaxID=301880 RepID=A0ABQ5GFL3_9ASTR
MTENPDIPRRLHEHYHRVENDEVVKTIFNSGKNKEGKGMKIPDWMPTEEMKHIAHYQIYVTVLRVDVPMTQSQLIESTQGTHRTPSAPRAPNPDTAEGESTAKINIDSLDEATRLIIATQRSLEDLEAQHNVEKVQEHMVDKEIGQLVEGNKNVDEDEFMNDIFNTQEDPDPRLEPRSDKETLKSAGDALIHRKGKGIEEIRDTPLPTPIRSPRTHIAPSSSDKEKLKDLTVTDPTPSSSTPSSSTPKPKRDHFNHTKNVICQISRRYGYMFIHLRHSFIPIGSLPLMVDKRVNEIAKKTVPLYVAEGLLLDRQKTQDNMAKMIAEALHQVRVSLRAELSTQINNDVSNSIPSQYLMMKDDEKLCNDDLSIWRSLKIKFEKPTTPSTQCRMTAIRTRDHEDHHDDDARPKGRAVRRDKIRLNMAHTQWVNLNQNKLWIKNQILSAQYGNSRPKKYTLSLHKYSAVPFPEDDIKERTSRWVSKRIRRLGFITEIMVRRANGKIDPITESDYKHLNKNDIEDLYLLCINGKVKDYRETGLLGSLSVFIRSSVIWERVHDFQLGMESYQQKVNLTAPTITFPSIEKKKLLTITSKPVVGLIYENNKKEKRVMILKEIPKFCDATLKRILEIVDVALKDSVTIGIPLPDGEGFTKETLQVESEWKPFAVINARSLVMSMINAPIILYGATAGKANWQTIKPKVRYEPKAHQNFLMNGALKVSTSAKDDPSKKLHARKGCPHVHTCKPSVPTSNPYDVLDDLESDEEAEVVYDETVNFKSTRTGVRPAMAPDVKNKGVADLTMVDFRGITRVPVHGKPEDIYEQISTIITEYITPEESIILNVISTSVDFYTCESISMSQRVDVTGQSTLAVARKQTKIR